MSKLERFFSIKNCKLQKSHRYIVLMACHLLLMVRAANSDIIINIGEVTPVLNNTSCSRHPEASSFVAHYIGILELKSNAFTPCLYLASIDLMMNELTYIDKDTFTGQRRLEVLNLIGNRLQHIHKDVFAELLNLKQLLLGFNIIKNFHPAVVRNLQYLEILRIQGNDFIDLDANKLYDHLPALQRVAFDNGRFSCNTLANLIQFFEGHNVQVELYHVNILPKDAITKNGRICVPDTLVDTPKEDSINVTQLYSEITVLNTRISQQQTYIEQLKNEMQVQSTNILSAVENLRKQLAKTLKEQAVVQEIILEKVQNITRAPAQVRVENLSNSEKKCLKTRYSNLY